MKKKKIMVIEDDPVILHLLQLRLKILDYEVCAIARTCEEAVKLVKETKPDIVLMDIRIPRKKEGIATAKAIKAHSDSQLFFFRDSAIRILSLAQRDSTWMNIPPNFLLIGPSRNT